MKGSAVFIFLMKRGAWGVFVCHLYIVIPGEEWG